MTTPVFAIDPAYVTADMPKVLWIELTSKCPFDCVFCTRKVRFGPGRHLDFEIFKRVISELDEPDFIGLNYSGESVYYPRLLEAIALAKSTGAFTELVTAFSTVSKPLLRGIVESGLDRLAVSIHTMDAGQYQSIYRFGSLDGLKQRIDEFFELRAGLGVSGPRLDFCFVAMNENLDQLPRVAEYARSLGIAEVSVHPVIGRHPVPHDFSIELTGNKLRENFKRSLRDSIETASLNSPGVAINVLNPDLDPAPHLSDIPAYFGPPLPEGARIHTCDQSPFESVHILATGNVVVCEVHDEMPMGNLESRSLKEIWHGDAYREFRRGYAAATIARCRNCVWKFAYLPKPWVAQIDASHGMSPQLLRGWHTADGLGTVWSRKRSLLALANQAGGARLRLSGTLPPGSDHDGSHHDGTDHENTLTIGCNREPLGIIRNRGSEFLDFEDTFLLQSGAPYFYVEFSVEQLFRPSLHGESNDGRDLGFALHRVEVL
jgi:MoaA/NifB/PqqE/SkfB family radical SAM enzyme